MRGIDLTYAVSKLMGHQSTEMTERYTYLAPNYLKNAVNALMLEGQNCAKTCTSQSAIFVSPYGPVAQKDRAAVS